MLKGIDFNQISTILEPSAGKGDIVKYINNELKRSKYKYMKHNIDCIELDKNLQYILKGEGFRVIHDDFLTFNSVKKYNLIIMNPPFDEGDKHLLKAIEIQEKHGGKIVCFLNAETIRNPYSKYRKDLQNKLFKYGAEIEFIENAFSNADRKTNIEVALIRIDIPSNRDNSVIIDHLKQKEQYKTIDKEINEIITSDYIDRIIQQYNFEVSAGVKLINEYLALKPMLSKSFDEQWSILEMTIYDNKKINDGALVNEFIRKIRYKYWSTLFQSDEFSKLMTTDLREQYMEKLDELQEYDFSKYNIEQIKIDMSLMLQDSLEQTILNMFDKFISYSYSDEYKHNIYLYNGWKTNSAYKISDKKIILPINAYGFFGDFSPNDYRFKSRIRDIEKVFTYLDSGKTQIEDDLDEILRKAREDGQTKNIECKYFYLTCYKKGTSHITWKNKDLVKAFNIFGSQKKGWLPPSYGKYDYDSMSKEEKKVVDDFEGEEEYKKVYNNKNVFLYDSGKMLALM